MTEQASRHNPEHVTPPPNMDGLHGRLVLADQGFLNPSSTFAPETTLVVSSFDQRNYQPFEKAAVQDRKEYWEKQPESSFDAQYNAWSTSLVNTFSNEKNHDIVEKLSPLLKKTAVMSESDTTFSADHAKKLYDRYFTADDGVKKFVADVLQTHPDAASLSGHMKEIHWIANIFGEKGKDMVKELTEAESRLKHEPNFPTKLVENPQNMRINHLSDKEKEILEFITKAKDTPLPHSNSKDDKHGEQAQGNKDEKKDERPLAPGELPIDRKKDEILNALKNHDTIFVIGGTGSGKTFKMPQMIREILEPDDKFIITEPRQINTSDIAKSVAKAQNVTIGEEIGFQHGDESKTSDKTKMLFATEGTILAKMMSDPLLKDTNYIMVDEVHIRSTDTEQLLFYIQQAQKIRKEKGMPPLKLIVTSATVNKDELVTKLNIPSEGIVEVEGRTYPIEEHYLPPGTPEIATKDMPEAAAKQIDTIIKSGEEGDIMIFVAGNHDINQIVGHLGSMDHPDVKIIKLHSGSTEEEKQEAGKDPQPGQRRIIIATNFAETGITIGGLKYVINTGEEFETTIDPKSGLERINKIKQSQANADQRRGRVGRKFPGVLYNLFTEADYKNRPPYPTPEIQRSDLTTLLLKMKKRGIHNPAELKVLSSPLDPQRIQFGEETLRKLDALNPDGSLTEIGKRMADFQTEYHYARMLIEAQQQGKGLTEICSIAAVDQARNIYNLSHPRIQEVRTKYQHPTSDFLTSLNVWKAFEANGFDKDWAENEGLNYQVLLKAQNSREKMLKRFQTSSTTPASEDELQQIIIQGYKDRIVKRNNTADGYSWERAPRVKFMPDRFSSLMKARSLPEYIVLGNASDVKGNNVAYIDKYQVVKPEWLAA